MQRSLQFVLPKVQLIGGLKCPLRAFSVSPLFQLKRPTFEGPEPPKRPLNAYMLYLRDKSSTVPSLDNGRLNLKALGEMWRVLPASEVKNYEKKAIQEKIQYEKNYQEFLQSIGGKKKQETYLEALKEYKAKKREYVKIFRLKKKDLLKPRKKSGYNMFVSKLMLDANASSLEETQVIMKSAAAKWKDLTDKAREAFAQEAELLHKEQLREYEKRCKKAVKNGELPMPESKEKTTKKPGTTTKTKAATATAKKKAGAKKRTASVSKTLQTLLKTTSADSLIEQLQKSQASADNPDTPPEEAFDAEEEAAIQGETNEVLNAIKAAEQPLHEEAELQDSEEGGVTEDIFADSDSSRV